MLETVRLNCENLEFSLRKPFDLLRDEKLVPLSGATGIRTPNSTMPWSRDPISLWPRSTLVNAQQWLSNLHHVR
jgi:hypothetical protein